MGGHLREGLQIRGFRPRSKVDLPLRSALQSPLNVGLRLKHGTAPLRARLFCRRRGSHARPQRLQYGIPRRQASPSKNSTPTSPCNMYISVDFTVRLHQYFKFQKMVCNTEENGLIHTEFNPLHKVEYMSLSDPAKRIRDVPNAGGNSVVSEVLSFEVLKRCFGAHLLKTEMEVSYFPEGGSITDYTCQIFDTPLGVSVTRAMKFKGDYTMEDAEKLLNKKLKGVVQSSKNTMEKWSKQILHIWATSSNIANIVTQCYNNISLNIKSNTAVLVTVAPRTNEIFKNR